VSALDACDAQPAIAHDAPALFGLGTTGVTFTATDDAGNSASCLADVKVQDTRPPVVACPAPAAVECTSPAGIAASDPQLAPFFAGFAVTDVCDAAPSRSNDAPGVFPMGQTTVTFTAADDSTNAASCASTVSVADTTPPQIQVRVSPATFWPPNHKMIAVTATVTVSDVCDPSVGFELVSITSNEPDNGLGDGDTANDIQDAQVGTADTAFLLRAERSGTGSGRTYTVTYRATDRAGNQATATAMVAVPH
jgi:HYR domain-containing protein